MDKNIKIFISFLSILFIIIGTFFLSQWLSSNKESLSSSDNELEKILDLVEQNTGEHIKESYGPLDLDASSLINLVHVEKKGIEYKISCRFGPAFETANLYRLFPEESVSMGQIRKCDIETAKAIDDAIRSPGIDCQVFMESEIPSSLNDYYFFAVDLGETEVTQEWIDKLTQKWINNEKALRCFEPLKTLLGETVARTGTGVVDLKKNIVYF